MKPLIESTYSRSEIADALASLFSSVVHLAVERPEITRPSGNGLDVIVTLGGYGDCKKWDVGLSALGFQAVSSMMHFDLDDDGEEVGDGWFDVNEQNEIVVNVEMAEMVCVEHSMGISAEVDDIDFMTSLIVTPIHELIHIADWFDKSGGRTPLQIFDEERGEVTLAKMVEDTDETTEDRIETQSLMIAEELVVSYPSLRDEISHVLTLLPRKTIEPAART